MFNLIVIKNGVKAIYKSQNKNINSNFLIGSVDLWLCNYKNFIEILNINKIKRVNSANLKEQLTIDFDNREYVYKGADSVFDGFYIPALYFDLKKPSEYQSLFPILLNLIESNLIEKEVMAYYSKDNSYESDTIIDISVRFDLLTIKELESFIKNYREISDNPELVEKYFKVKNPLSSDVNNLQFVKIPLHIKDWTIKVSG